MTEPRASPHHTDLIGGSISEELSSANTSLAFERTRMAADSTLLGIIRTSLSLIGFGFTLNQVFSELAVKHVLTDANETARRLGEALLALGLLILIMGIWGHAKFGRELTRRRARLFDMNLLHSPMQYHATPTFLVAFLLLVIGVVAMGSIIFRTVF